MIKKIMAASLLGFSILTAGYVGYVKYSSPKLVTAATSKEVQARLGKIFNNIKTNTGQALNVSLQLVDDKEINAYTDGTTITVNTGLVQAIGDNDDALALVIGHEMAHVTLMHNKVDDTIIPQVTKEAQADKLGEWYAMRAGYNPCNARDIFVKMKVVYGDDPSGDHPDFAYRLDQLTMPWCNKV